MEATHVECSISNEFIPIEQSVTLDNGDIADSELNEVQEVDGEWYNTEDGEIHYVEDRQEWVHDYNCTYSSCMEEYVHEDDGEFDYSGEDYATGEWFGNNDYCFISRGSADGTYLYCEQAIYCEDIEESVHEDDAHWDDDDELWYWDADNISGSDNEHISEYHRSPKPEDLSKDSQFAIGIEIEKVSFEGVDCRGDHVGDYELFKGFETDSSCGVEAITHILPLDKIGSENETDVFKMFDDASDIIDEDDVDSSCGGHMTVSCKTSHSSQEMREKMRVNSAIIYALYRYRLKNTYCVSDKDMKQNNPHRYSPILPKRNGLLEFRIFSRVTNVNQLKLRYRLMYKLMDYSMNKDTTYSVFLLSVLPILREMYNGNEDKLKEVMKLSYKFKTFLELGYVDEDIREFLSEYYKPKNQIQTTLCV